MNITAPTEHIAFFALFLGMIVPFLYFAIAIFFIFFIVKVIRYMNRKTELLEKSIQQQEQISENLKCIKEAIKRND